MRKGRQVFEQNLSALCGIYHSVLCVFLAVVNAKVYAQRSQCFNADWIVNSALKELYEFRGK